MTQTIVVPLDGSDRAEQAIPWAAALAGALGHTVTLVQVIPWPIQKHTGITGAYLSDDEAERIRADVASAARDYLDRLKALLASQGVQTYVEIAVGNVVETILDVADEHGASTIAIASHGHGGLTRFMIGGTTQQLVQQALIPVLVVRTGAGATVQPSLRTILVPIDGSVLAESAIELASSLAGRGTELVLARVVQPIEVPVPSAVDVGSVIDWHSTDEVAALAEADLNRQADALERAGIRTRRVMRTGRIATELRQIADDYGADLIVIATHGRTGFDRLMLGSVADDLSRHARQPTLLVSARAMTARLIEPFTVRDVMTRDIASVRDDEPLGAVVRKLLRRRVSGAPVITADGVLVGVISEHDLIAWHSRLVDEVGRDEALLDPAVYQERLGTDRVASIMTAPAIAVERDAPLAAALHLLVHRRLRRLPVVQDERLVGVITRSDVLRAIEAREAEVSAGTTGA